MRKAKWITVLFWLAFMIGLPLFIYKVLDDHSDRFAESSCLAVYEMNGHTIVAVLTQSNKAHSVNRGVTYSTANYYAQAIDMHTGELLWETKLKSKEWSSGNRLLGQSDKYLFYDRGQLFVIDKKNGNIIADNEKLQELNPAIQGRLPKDYMSYDFDAVSRQLLFTGNDAMNYAIDGNSLLLQPNTTRKIRKWNDRKKTLENTLARSDISGDRWIGLVIENDSDNVKKFKRNVYRNNYIVEQARRYLYTGSLYLNNKEIVNFRRLSDKVFLFGDFLRDNNRPYGSDSLQTVFKELKAVEDSYRFPSFDKETADFSSTDEYLKARREYEQPFRNRREQLYKDFCQKWDLKSTSQYNTFHYKCEAIEQWLDPVPLRLIDPARLIILHRETTDRSAPLLLSVINEENGAVLWTLTLPFSNLRDYQLTGKNNLIISGGQSSNEINHIVLLQLDNGQAKSFGLRRLKAEDLQAKAN